MIETPEQIQEILSVAGEELTFPSFFIYGFPGMELHLLHDQERSPYLTEIQIFTFQISAQDYKENAIARGNTFIYTDGTYNYTFSVDRSGNLDLTGWLALTCNFVSKVPV